MVGNAGVGAGVPSCQLPPIMASTCTWSAPAGKFAEVKAAKLEKLKASNGFVVAEASGTVKVSDFARALEVFWIPS